MNLLSGSHLRHKSLPRRNHGQGVEQDLRSTEAPTTRPSCEETDHIHLSLTALSPRRHKRCQLVDKIDQLMGRKSRITEGKSSPSGIPRLPKGAMQDRIITRELCASKIVENLVLRSFRDCEPHSPPPSKRRDRPAPRTPSLQKIDPARTKGGRGPDGALGGGLEVKQPRQNGPGTTKDLRIDDSRLTR